MKNAIKTTGLCKTVANVKNVISVNPWTTGNKKKGGDIMISRIVINHAIDSPLDGTASNIYIFTAREYRVAELSAEGKSDDEIAEILKINLVHVDDIRTSILNKAGIYKRGS